jgi:hypothetical protein
VHQLGIDVDRRADGALPQLPGRFDELCRAFVPALVRQPAAMPEVLARPRVVRGHDVPAGPAAGDEVQAGQTARQVGRVVVGRVLGGDQPDPVGDGGERGQLGDRVGAAGYVEIEDLPAVLPHAQALTEEERVEQAPFQ